MGKHPREDFRWLEEELLAVEAKEEVVEEPVPETDDEDAWLRETKALLGESVPNPAVDWGRTLYDDEAFDEGFDADAALEALTPRQKRAMKKQEKARIKQEKKEKKLEKKRSRIGDLVFLAILELLGILAVIGWWIQWLT